MKNYVITEDVPKYYKDFEHAAIPYIPSNLIKKYCNDVGINIRPVYGLGYNMYFIETNHIVKRSMKYNRSSGYSYWTSKKCFYRYKIFKCKNDYYQIIMVLVIGLVETNPISFVCDQEDGLLECLKDNYFQIKLKNNDVL